MYHENIIALELSAPVFARVSCEESMIGSFWKPAPEPARTPRRVPASWQGWLPSVR